MDHFAGLDVSVKETSVCIVDDTGRAGSFAAGSDERHLPLQADRTGSRATVAVAFQCSGRGGLAGDLCRDAAHASGAEGADQQDGSQRRTRYGTDDAGGALPSGACEDVTQPETADVVDPSQAAAVQGHRYR